MHIHTCICTHISTHTYICIYMYMCIYVCMCIHVYIYVCVCTYICICIRIEIERRHGSTCICTTTHYYSVVLITIECLSFQL